MKSGGFHLDYVWCFQQAGEEIIQFSLLLFLQGGVGRVHLLDSNIQGALLLELYTRDGVGTMVSRCVGNSSCLLYPRLILLQ
jgi:hypothetical protein